MIPNKTMAQSQIVILSNNQRTLRHSQLLRFDFDADINEVKRIIMNCLLEMPDILQDPAPRVLLIETTESWLAVKVFYSIRDFSLKYRVADEVLVNIMGHLKEQGIHLATNRLHLGNREVTTVAKS